MSPLYLVLTLICLTYPAAAQPPGIPPDICDLEYRNGGFVLLKGEKVFSEKIRDIDAVIKMEQGLTDTGVCRKQRSLCTLKFDGLRPGHYYIYRNGKRFSVGFLSLGDAEIVLAHLTDYDVCVTAD